MAKAPHNEGGQFMSILRNVSINRRAPLIFIASAILVLSFGLNAARGAPITYDDVLVAGDLGQQDSHGCDGP